MQRNNVCHKNSCKTGNNIASKKDRIILFYRKSMINPLAIEFVKYIHLKNPYTEDSMDDSTWSRWFRNFQYGDQICKKHSCFGSPSMTSDKDLYIDKINSPHPVLEKVSSNIFKAQENSWKTDASTWFYYETRSVGTTPA